MVQCCALHVDDPAPCSPLQKLQKCDLLLVSLRSRQPHRQPNFSADHATHLVKRTQQRRLCQAMELNIHTERQLAVLLWLMGASTTACTLLSPDAQRRVTACLFSRDSACSLPYNESGHSPCRCRWIGVHKIFLRINFVSVPDNLAQLLSRHINDGVLDLGTLQGTHTVLHNQWYNQCVKSNQAGAYDWAAFIDLDEFVVMLHKCAVHFCCLPKAHACSLCCCSV